MFLAQSIREKVEEILPNTRDELRLKRIAQATKLLLMKMGVTNVKCRVRTWDDHLPFHSEKAVLFMVRSQELYRSQYEDEAMKYESLAVNYALNSK